MPIRGVASSTGRSDQSGLQYRPGIDLPGFGVTGQEVAALTAAAAAAAAVDCVLAGADTPGFVVVEWPAAARSEELGTRVVR